MNNIATYEDLKTEKQRLTLLLHEREMALKSEFEVVKQRLKPVGSLLEFAEKITTKDKNNPMVNTGIDIGVNFLLRNLLLRNAGMIAKVLMPVLVRNYITHEVHDNAGWVQKIGKFFKKQFS